MPEMPSFPPRPNSLASALAGVRTSTWIGTGLTVFFGLIALVSGGFWSMLMIIALIALGTTFYGVVLRRRTWIRLPAGRSKAAIGMAAALVVLLGASSAYGATHPTPTGDKVAAVSAADPSKSASPIPSPSPTPTPTPVVTVGDFATSGLQSTQDALTELGLTYTIVSTDGRTVSDSTGWTVQSTSPAAGASLAKGSTVRITAIPPYTAPPAPKPAPKPAPAPAAPAPAPAPAAPAPAAPAPAPAPAAPAPAPDDHAGATAKCNDGSLSYSAHRRGTCSHHGGVAVWY